MQLTVNKERVIADIIIITIIIIIIFIFILIIIFYNLPSTKKGWLLTLSGSTESVKPCVKAFIGLTGETRAGSVFCNPNRTMDGSEFFTPTEIKIYKNKFTGTGQHTYIWPIRRSLNANSDFRFIVQPTPPGKERHWTIGRSSNWVILSKAAPSIINYYY